MFNPLEVNVLSIAIENYQRTCEEEIRNNGPFADICKRNFDQLTSAYEKLKATDDFQKVNNFWKELFQQ